MMNSVENVSHYRALGKLRAELEQVGAAVFTAPDYLVGTIHHVVLFRYREGVSEATQAEIKGHFLALQYTATRAGQPYIAAIVSGAQNSGECAEHGFEQGFIVIFNSAGDRNYYVGEPVICQPEYFDKEHAAFKEFVGPYLVEGSAGVLVFDFVSE